MKKSTKERTGRKPQQKPSEQLMAIVEALNDFDDRHLCLDLAEGTEFYQAAALLESFAESLAGEGI